MFEYLGNCVINLNGAAFTGRVMFQPGNPDDEIDPVLGLEIKILDDFKELAAGILNCTPADIDISCTIPPGGDPVILLNNGGGGGQE